MFNLLTVIGVGFLLGIRHATDPDHVIAVTTIVSRQRSIRHAGLMNNGAWATPSQSCSWARPSFSTTWSFRLA